MDVSLGHRFDELCVCSLFLQVNEGELVYFFFLQWREIEFSCRGKSPQRYMNALTIGFSHEIRNKDAYTKKQIMNFVIHNLNSFLN